MKIALAQLNYHIGNLNSNTNNIIQAIKLAKKKSADLIVFSELSVCGYIPMDLLENRDFIQRCEKSVTQIAKECDDISAIIGVPTINKNQKGKNLFNSAIFIENNKIKQTVNKTLLPTYDIFDEYRYFESNSEFNIIEFKGRRIALTICEDLWDEQKVNTEFEKEMLYEKSPMHFLNKEKPDLIINIAASPYQYNHAETRKEILTKNSIKYKLPLVYVNQVGANTDLIFDGGSFVLNNKGEIINNCKYFEEDLIFTDISDINNKNEIQQTAIDKYKNINQALVLGVKDFFKKNGFKKATLGLSGGIDSALTLAIAIQAIGSKNITALLLPSKYSSQHSIDDSVEMAERCNVEYHTIDIDNLRQQFESTLEPLFSKTESDTTEENIQARIRAVILMALSNKFGHILLNTSNKSEAAVGYTTLYGDMSGGLSVLGDVYKTDVYKLSEYINNNIAPIIPDNIINKVPSAELRYDQKDSDSLPEYHILDGILYNYIEKKLSIQEITAQGYNIDVVKKVINLVNYSEYKRFQSPPILRISSKAFGFGRRMPLVAKYL